MTYQRFSGADALNYDQDMQDWPGEIDFYLKFARAAKEKGQSVLDIACGTGRVALQLAQAGVRVVGLDVAADMLALARQKAQGLTNTRWVEGDMRAFDLGERFGLVIIAVHSFQFMLTPQDQLECLRSIRRHLVPGGLLIIHNNHDEIDWLGDIQISLNPPFEAGKIFVHPETGVKIRPWRRWMYSPATQTCTQYTEWEELDEADTPIQRHEFSSMPMHVVFPCEMEHLLYRVGFEGIHLFGDFYEHPFAENSRDLIWLAREPDGQ
jgi:ubiquinone/menaquinone biosynthesis C-methylase UbiE